MNSTSIEGFDLKNSKVLQLMALITKMLTEEAILLAQISADMRESPQASTIQKGSADDYLKLSYAVQNLAVALTYLEKGNNNSQGLVH